MLIEFSVGNYRSFKDIVTFSMVASTISSRNKSLDTSNVVNIPSNSNLRLLKSAAIYGANASGKSNLTKALAFMKMFVLNSSKDTQAAEPIRTDPFRLSTDTARGASHFEIVFLMENKRYRYGFEVTNQHVVKEWLFFVPTIKEARLFVRQDDKISIGSSYKEGRRLVGVTRNNALFLSVIAQFNGALSQQILTWFRNLNIISGLNDEGYIDFTIRCLQNSETRSHIIRFVKNLDLGIDNIEIEETKITSEMLPPNIHEEVKRIMLSPETVYRPSIKTIHQKVDTNGKPVGVEVFDMEDNESQGTAKLFSLAGPIVNTLRHGKVLIVDEMDARLHPLLTLAIIELFNSEETNSRNAQLIFTTHDTNLLNNRLFRRDQIWFTEKNREGITDLYSLVEYKIRNDASFESDYIKGRYGAIPFIGDIRRLVGVTDE